MTDSGSTAPHGLLDDEEVALFPLHCVLFPDGPLELRIFEPRYLDMVSECLREDRPFGVCLITSGSEVGAPAQTVDVGTLARIVDWQRDDDGLLGIGCLGGARFRVLGRRAQSDQLVRGRIRRLPEPATAPVPDEHRDMVELLREFVAASAPLYADIVPRYDDAAWVARRIAENLPLAPVLAQHLLEQEDAPAALAQVHDWVQRLAGGED